MYLPAILYRITLKSTAWLYLPLIWMAHVPATLQEAKRQEVWVKSSARNWIGLLTAVATLAFAGYLAFDRAALPTLTTTNEAQPFTPFHAVWAFDPSQWALWFWVTVPSAALTVGLWVWTNRISSSLDAGGQLDWHSTQLRCLIGFNQIKNALVIAWIIITFLSVARLGWLLGKLPDWMGPVFEGFILPVTNLWSS